MRPVGGKYWISIPGRVAPPETWSESNLVALTLLEPVSFKTTPYWGYVPSIQPRTRSVMFQPLQSPTTGAAEVSSGLEATSPPAVVQLVVLSVLFQVTYGDQSR